MWVSQPGCAAADAIIVRGSKVRTVVAVSTDASSVMGHRSAGRCHWGVGTVAAALRRLALVVLLIAVVFTGAGALVAAVTGARAQPVLTGAMSPAVPAYSLVIGTPLPASTVRTGTVIFYTPPPGTGAGPLVARVAVVVRSGGSVFVRTAADRSAALDPWQVDLNTTPVYRVEVTLPGAGLAYALVADVVAGVPALLAGCALLLLAVVVAGHVGWRRYRSRRAYAAAALDADGVAAALAWTAHELRAGLAGVLGNAELLAERSQALDPQDLHRAQVIHRHAQQLAVLADRLTVLADLDLGAATVKPAPLALATLIDDLANGELAAAGVRVINLIDPATYVNADVRQLRRVVRELVTAAVASGTPEDPVHVSSREDTRAGTVTLSVSSKSTTTIGYPEAPFARPAPVQDRPSGPALTIAEHLLRGHRTRLVRSATPGHRSYLSVRLAAASGPPPPATPSG